MAQDFYTNLSRRILEKLVDGMVDIKTFYDGDPLIIGASRLPAVIVDWDITTPMRAPTGHDKYMNSIIIKVVLNKMDDVGIEAAKAGTSKILETPTKKRLERYIFGRDGATAQFLPDTVMGILRTNFSMDGHDTSQDATVQFGNSQRPGNGDTIVTAEAHITIAISELIQVSGRT